MFDPEEKNRKGTLYDRTELLFAAIKKLLAFHRVPAISAFVEL